MIRWLAGRRYRFVTTCPVLEQAADVLLVTGAVAIVVALLLGPLGLMLGGDPRWLWWICVGLITGCIGLWCSAAALLIWAGRSGRGR